MSEMHGNEADRSQEQPPAEPLFLVFCDDNAHYMSEEERTPAGRFGAYDEAVAFAKEIVDASLEEHGYDYRAYTTFGTDPFVAPEPPGEHFSAWQYAEERCRRR